MLKDTVYTLKSIIVHMGSSVEEERGHIITLLNTSNGWITCDDSLVSEPSRSPPQDANQGYLLIYDKVEDIPPPP